MPFWAHLVGTTNTLPRRTFGVRWQAKRDTASELADRLG
jgi:hypothetical protein